MKKNSAAMFRIGFRLLYWGCLAHAILRVKKDIGAEAAKEEAKKDKYADSELPTLMLQFTAEKWLETHHSQIKLFGSYHNQRAFAYTGLARVAFTGTGV